MNGGIRVVVGACWKTSWRLQRAWMVNSRMWGGIQLSNARASAPAALITLSSGVTVGLVKYLHLKKAMPKM
jgi:hypothetical protein